MPHNPSILGGPQTKGHKIKSGCLNPALSGAQKGAAVLRHPCILGGPQTKRDGIRTGCLTPVTLGAQKRAQVLRNPCILGDPQARGHIISDRLTLALSRGQKRAKVLCNPCILVSTQQRGQNQKWLPHPYLLEGPKEGGSAMPPLHSRGSPNKGGQNHKWPPHPCLLRGPKAGGSATSLVSSWGSPTKGTTSEVATSPLPSRRPKRGWRCYVTLAFSGVPNKGDKIRSG